MHLYGASFFYVHTRLFTVDYVPNPFLTIQKKWNNYLDRLANEIAEDMLIFEETL